MKILFVVHSLDPGHGGLFSSLPNLAQILAANNHLVDIAYIGGKSQLPATEQLFANIVSQKQPRLLAFGGWHCGGLRFSRGLTRWLLSDIRFYDVVHIHGLFNYPSAVCAAIAQRYQVPYVVSIHGMLFDWARRHKALKKKLFHTVAQRKLLTRATFVHALTETEAESIRCFEPRSVLRTIPNGINPIEEGQRSESELLKQLPQLYEKRIILFLGRIHPIKGVELLIEAFRCIHKDFTDVHLLLAGEGNDGYLKKLKQQTNNSSLNSAITFAGLLDDSLKHTVLSQADIFVLPSHSEGLSLAMLESFAHGVPTVITRGCHFPEAEDLNIALIAEQNATDISKCIKQLLRDRQMAKILGENARRVMQSDFTWDTLYTRYFQMYQECTVSGSIKYDNG